jgi:hypothetical protein
VSVRWDWLQMRTSQAAGLPLPWKVATTGDDGCAHSFNEQGCCVHCGTVHPAALDEVRGTFCLLAEEQMEGAALWEQVTRQRDKISERLSWLAANECDPEWPKRAALVTASRELWERQLVALAAWAGVTPGEVAGLLLESEEVEGEPLAPPRPAARGETRQPPPQWAGGGGADGE